MIEFGQQIGLSVLSFVISFLVTEWLYKTYDDIE